MIEEGMIDSIRRKVKELKGKKSGHKYPKGRKYDDPGHEAARRIRNAEREKYVSPFGMEEEKTFDQFLKEGLKSEKALGDKVKKRRAKDLIKTGKSLNAKDLKDADEDGDGIVRVIDAGYEPEGEVLDELKTSTLRNYVNKASIDAVGRGVDAGIKGMTGPKDEMEKNMTKAYKRQRGINRAANKLASRAERKEEVALDERLGGKGYKRRKDYAGRTVEGDWPDSDRGGGHKAKKRSGEKVEKKSPTYQAYVLNKEEVVNEVAPPTKKHERMVKHIKKSYAKDGGLTDQEKSIAYATAWKNYNKDK